MAKKSGGLIAPVFVFMILVAACLWTSLTGALSHWPLVLIAVAVCLAVAKAITTGGKK
jgi:hypothetical protein